MNSNIKDLIIYLEITETAGGHDGAMSSEVYSVGDDHYYEDGGFSIIYQEDNSWTLEEDTFELFISYLESNQVFFRAKSNR